MMLLGAFLYIYIHIWTRWDLNPGPSPRKGDDLPLIYEPQEYPSILSYINFEPTPGVIFQS